MGLLVDLWRVSSRSGAAGSGPLGALCCLVLPGGGLVRGARGSLIVCLIIICSGQLVATDSNSYRMVRSVIQSVSAGDCVIVKDSSGFYSGRVTSVKSGTILDDDSGDSGAAVRLTVPQALTAARRHARQQKIVNPVAVAKEIKKVARKPNRTRSIGVQTTDGGIKEGWIAWLRDDLEQTLLYDGVERLLKVNVPDVMSKLIKRVFDKEERLARGLAYRPDQSYSRTLF